MNRPSSTEERDFAALRQRLRIALRNVENNDLQKQATASAKQLITQVARARIPILVRDIIAGLDDANALGKKERLGLLIHVVSARRLGAILPAFPHLPEALVRCLGAHSPAVGTALTAVAAALGQSAVLAAARGWAPSRSSTPTWPAALILDSLVAALPGCAEPAKFADCCACIAAFVTAAAATAALHPTGADAAAATAASALGQLLDVSRSLLMGSVAAVPVGASATALTENFGAVLVPITECVTLLGHLTAADDGAVLAAAGIAGLRSTSWRVRRAAARLFTALAAAAAAAMAASAAARHTSPPQVMHDALEDPVSPSASASSLDIQRLVADTLPHAATPAASVSAVAEFLRSRHVELAAGGVGGLLRLSPEAAAKRGAGGGGGGGGLADGPLPWAEATEALGRGATDAVAAVRTDCRTALRAAAVFYPPAASALRRVSTAAGTAGGRLALDADDLADLDMAVDMRAVAGGLLFDVDKLEATEAARIATARGTRTPGHVTRPPPPAVVVGTAAATTPRSRPWAISGRVVVDPTNRRESFDSLPCDAPPPPVSPSQPASGWLLGRSPARSSPGGMTTTSDRGTTPVSLRAQHVAAAAAGRALAASVAALPAKRLSGGGGSGGYALPGVPKWPPPPERDSSRSPRPSLTATSVSVVAHRDSWTDTRDLVGTAERLAAADAADAVDLGPRLDEEAAHAVSPLKPNAAVNPRSASLPIRLYAVSRIQNIADYYRARYEQMALKAKAEYEREIAQFVGDHRPALQREIESLHAATLAAIERGADESLADLTAGLAPRFLLNPECDLRRRRDERAAAAAEAAAAEARAAKSAVASHPVSRWAWVGVWSRQGGSSAGPTGAGDDDDDDDDDESAPVESHATAATLQAAFEAAGGAGGAPVPTATGAPTA